MNRGFRTTSESRSCSRISRALVAAIALASLLVSSGRAWAQNLPALPTGANIQGDQIIFFFDTRPDHTTFLTIGNDAPTGVVLEIVYYSQGLDTRLVEEVISLAGGAAKVIDPTSQPAVVGKAGLIVVTPIVSQADHTPVVPPRPIVGGFTIANLPLGAGFGENPFGRLALTGAPGVDGPRAPAGTVVDGVAVSYQSIQPLQREPSLTLPPVYFNPTTLSPPENDGNRLLLAAFQNRYADPVGPGNQPRFNLAPVTVNTTVSFFAADTGLKIVTNRPVAVSGVRFETLQSLSGGVTLDQPGRVEFTLAAFSSNQDSFFGLFSEALGTFSVCQRLVPIDIL